MNLVVIAGDDTFTTAGPQSVVSIRLDSAPTDDAGNSASIQLSADSSAPTTASGFGLTSEGTQTSVTATSPADYVWSVDGVVQIGNLNPATKAVALRGTAPRAGEYGFTTWVNDGMGSNTVLDPGEPYTTGTLIVGGDVASFVMAPTTRVAVPAQQVTFAVSAKDSAGRPTFPVGDDTTGPWGSLTVTPGSGVTVETGGVTTSGGLAKLTASAFINPTYSAIQGVASVKITATNLGQYSVSVGPGGTLPGTVTVAAATLGVIPAATLQSAISSGPSANSSNAVTYTPQISITASNVATGDVFLPTTEATARFTMSATSGASVGQVLPYAVVDGASGSEAGVTSGTFTAAIDASKKATVEITATDIQPGDYYAVVLGQGTSKVAYTVTYESPALSVTNLTTVPGKGSTTYAKTNTAVSVAATVTDQYGQRLPNVTVASLPSVSPATTAVTDDSGAARITIPAAGSAASQKVDFTVQAPFGTPTSATGQPITVLYNASGSPASLAASSSAGNVNSTASAIQNVDASGAAAATWNANGSTGWMAVTATVGGGVTGIPVIFSAPDTYFSSVPGATSLSTASVKKGEIVGSTGGGGTVTVYAKATKTGTVTVTLKAGDLTAPIAWIVANAPNDARVLVVTPATQEAKGTAQVTATVTDVFGNTVANAPLTFSEDGVGNFASGTSTLGTFTGPNGSVTVGVMSATPGDSTVTVIAAAAADYAGLPDSPEAGSPAGVSRGIAAIAFQEPRALAITGSRTTVSGKPGIQVDGRAKGLAVDDAVIPYVKFPGQEDYSQGAARPVIDSAGAFTWSRKTGKKAYVYFTSTDGMTKSNTVTIRAS